MQYSNSYTKISAARLLQHPARSYISIHDSKETMMDKVITFVLVASLLFGPLAMGYALNDGAVAHANKTYYVANTYSE